MPDDPRVQQLLEELLGTGTTPEEVCGSCIELLPVVRARWRQVCRARAELDAMFPPAGTSDSSAPASVAEVAPLPVIPGYEVEAVLGAGGMGIVFKARHLRLNRVVALKMVLSGAYASAHERERFQREAEAVAALRHENVVHVHDVGDSDGRPYFTMEYVEGGSLAEKLAGTPLPAREAAALLATLAGAVDAAHRAGIIHRDLKPANVLLTAEGVPKISDFGLARRLDGEAGLTRTGTGVGTPSYMAPEQALGKAGAVGPPADVYALGAILYELLTGRPPFRAESAAETVHQLLTRDPVPPSLLNNRVPRDLETICLQCLSKESRLRYTTAAALNDDLQRFLRGDAISARPESRLRRAIRRVRRRPAIAVGSAAGLLVASLLLIGGSWLVFDRAVTDRAVAGDLDEMENCLRKSSWAEAKTASERAQTRLGNRESPALRQRLDQGTRDSRLADRLETIRLDLAVIVDGVVNFAQGDKDYEGAFRESGIGQIGDDPEAVAARVRESNIRTTLLAALDHWPSVARTPARADWGMAVADRAEPNPTAWRTDARNREIRRDRQALINLIENAPVADEPVSLLLALSSFLVAVSEPPPDPVSLKVLKQAPAHGSEHQIPFLAKVQRAHPDDLWANISLGDALLHGNKPEESLRYFQAVIALRPRLIIGYHYLGMALNRMGMAGSPERYDESIAQLRKALEIEPESVKTHLVLVGTLGAAGRHDEAIAQVHIALRFNYQVAILRATLGINLRAKGRVEEGHEQLRLAFGLEPNNPIVQNGYREVLTKERRWAEMRPIWGKALEGDRPDHDDWYGYAELCLYLGQKEEYRRARQALLARFGTSDSPYTAERAARACLLLPASGEELSKAVALAEVASTADRKKFAGPYPNFQFVKGIAEYRQGHFDRAIAIMRGDASKMDGPLPPLVLAMALHQTGKGAEARKTFAAAMLSHEWRENQVDSPDGWIRHVLRREAESMILPNLAAMLEGKQQPGDNDERIAQIGVCRFENRFAALARVYTGAFAADPKLANNHRLNAARVAVQAGCGYGVDAGGIGEEERRNWRGQARKWLRGDLSAWTGALDRDFKEAHDNVRRVLTGWRNEPELAGIREPAELEKLLTDERKDCRDLWADVDAVLDRLPKPK